MYSSDKCHFCNSVLHTSRFDKSQNEKFCFECKDSYRYNVTVINDSWVVTFRIKKYYFQMFYNVFDEIKESLEIVGPNDEIISIPECRLITTDNYLEEVERAKKLQVFK